MLFRYLLAVLCFSNSPVQAQDPSEQTRKEVPAVQKVEANRIFNIDLMLNGDLPMADMAKRFGPNYRLGIGFRWKTKKNWFFGAKGELIIGNKIREDSLMANLMTTQNGVITQLGDVLNVGTFERGYLVGIQAGRIFPVLAVNPNSGLTTMFGIGFLQHKIKLFDQDNSFPQLRNEYVKGYDRLSNGWYLENFTGYTFYSKNKLINAYAGINWVCSFTRGRRAYLYDVQRADNRNRLDMLIGLKFGWVIPVYKKQAEEIYY